MKRYLHSAALLLIGISTAIPVLAECPDGKSEVLLMTPSGRTKTICVSDNAIPGIENAADHTDRLIVPQVGCVGKIDALILEYDASQAGNRAIQEVSWYAGDYPDDLLINTIGPVFDGQVVNFDGFQTVGSPNDVQFFIQFTDSSTAISEFHLSCSDDEMNDITDCGALQGNGKDNMSGINTWILRDLALSNGEVLGCP